MQIEIKINGELADLQEVLKVLLIKPTTTATETAKAALEAATAKAKETPAAAPLSENMKEEINLAAVDGHKDKPQPEAPKTETQVSNPSTDTTISFEEFRATVGAAALVDKEKVKLILKEFGATKTSEVDPNHFYAIMQDLTRIK